MEKLNVEELYQSSVKRLDNFYQETQIGLIEGGPPNNWKGETIFNLLHQSTNILFVLLNHTEGSEYQSNPFITEQVLIGSLGRIFRDIYVNIIYLTTNKFSEDDMKTCWSYQIACQKLNITKYLPEKDTNYRLNWKLDKENLEARLKELSFSTKSQVLQGKCERLLSISELAEIKGFNKDIFTNEFEYFSQFSHSTAFANSISKPGHGDKRVLAITYFKILIYYIGIVTEALKFITPNHTELFRLEAFYNEQIKKFWN